ncbi:MAG: hypothetical protein AAF567_16835 [Actinomycetota bacterium]
MTPPSTRPSDARRRVTTAHTDERWLQLGGLVGNRAARRLRPGASLDEGAGIQRTLLITYGNNEQTPTADGLGFENVTLTRYAHRIAQDPQALASGSDRRSKNEAIKQLKNSLLDVDIGDEKTTITNHFIRRISPKNNPDLWAGLTLNSIPRAWRQAVEALYDGDDGFSFADYFGGDDLDDPAALLNALGGVSDFNEVMTSALAVDEDTVGSLASLAPGLPNDEFRLILGYSIYERARFAFYDADVDYEDAFISLIAAIDGGEIAALPFVTRYASGAEFEVTDGRFRGKAVVHTHYHHDEDGHPAGPPVYAHTKPEDDRMGGGYGWSSVKLSEILKIDDARKAYEDLV